MHANNRLVTAYLPNVKNEKMATVFITKKLELEAKYPAFPLSLSRLISNSCPLLNSHCRLSALCRMR
jgi:hypothetical protein